MLGNQTKYIHYEKDLHHQHIKIISYCADVLVHVSNGEYELLAGNMPRDEVFSLL